MFFAANGIIVALVMAIQPLGLGDGSKDEWFRDDCGKIENELVDVQPIVSTNVFAALRADGNVDTWGGSDSSENCSEVIEKLATDVKSVYSTTSDGSVVIWGDKEKRGDCYDFKEQLTADLQSIYQQWPK